MNRVGPPTELVAHALVDSLDGLAADDELTRHLWTARRLKPGTAVSVTDGLGSWRLARLGGPGELIPDGAVQTVATPDPVSVAFAPVKGERPEWCVQKLTEVGVDRIVVLQTDRSVVRWKGDRGRGQVAKLARVAKAALEQCRRVWLPTIVGPCTLDELIGSVESVTDLVVDRPWVRADGSGRQASTEDRSLLIGPEGGFTPREQSLVTEAISLGPHVMRAETAAMVGGAQLVALREYGERGDHGELSSGVTLH